MQRTLFVFSLLYLHKELIANEHHHWTPGKPYSIE